MDDIYSRIKIIPADLCLVHEGIIEKWVGQIASNIKDQGTLKNPVIVTWHDPYYVVLDGMHRFAALQQLEIRDILVCEVDYFSPKIILEGWDAFIFRQIGARNLLCELFPESEGYRYHATTKMTDAKLRVAQRQSLLAVGDKDGEILLLEKENLNEKNRVEELCLVTDKVDRVLSERDLKVLYVDNSLTLDDFESSSAQSLVLRPQFSKQEVVDHTLNKKLFPPKSTRHLIPERPLRVDLDLSLLRANIDLKTKNNLLQEHLKWCYENNRVRFYPESVYVFAD
ncbi:MAG: ParB N-terminal domain-containing protein [Deltaproteobacteria bacterium]|nr:ParB N-terminal domain-containing protein [Deltaproteobacteria bacterium]